ncbi:MAG: hypothetical protein ACK521_04055 [bacterium]
MICADEIKTSQKTLVDLEKLDLESLHHEHLAREEMRSLNLAIDFYTFVEISRKVAYY